METAGEVKHMTPGEWWDLYWPERKELLEPWMEGYMKKYAAMEVEAAHDGMIRALKAALQALAFAKSAMLSGESYTDDADEMIGGAGDLVREQIAAAEGRNG